MDAATLKVAKNYTNEQAAQKATNSPVEEISFDGGIYSVGNNVVNGQVSDVVVKGRTINQLVEGKGDSLEGWLGIKNLSIQDGWFKYYSVATLVRDYFPVPIKQGHQYYSKLEIRVDTPDIGVSGALRLWLIKEAGLDEHVAEIFNFNRTTPNGIYSNIVTASGDGVGYGTRATSGDLELSLRNIMLVDLTATFGAGNEPTKEECDAMFPHYLQYGVKSTNSVRLVSVGKNLFNMNDISYYKDLYTQYDFIGVTTYRTKELKTKLKPNTQYIVSFTASAASTVTMLLHSHKQVNDAGFLDFRLAQDTKTFTTNSEGKLYIGAVIYSTNDAINKRLSEILTLKIVEGTTISDEPHKESIVNVNLSEPLRSLPNGVKDEVNVSSGVLTKNIERVILKGSENWSMTVSNTNTIRFQLTSFRLPKANGLTNIASDLFVTNDTVYGDTQDTEGISGSPSSGSIFIRIAKSKLATQDLAGFKTWLATNPITLNYQLATPVVTKLPAQAPLQVFENGTVYVEPIGDASESTLPSVEMTIPTGTSNKFGVATHDYDGAATDWVLTNSESKCFLLAVSNAGGSANIIAPDAPGVMYAISNASGQTITVKISGGTGVAITNAKTVLVIHNGTDYTALTAEL